MFNPLAVIAMVIAYIGALFLVALWAEKRAAAGNSPAANPLIYSLSLAVYCTSWTFYGSVGKAATSGMLFLAIYLGPTVGMVLWWTVLRKMVRIKSAHRITSIADFISARYEKSEPLAALATTVALVGVMPYIGLQLKSVISTFELITVSQSSDTTWVSGHMGPISVVLMIVFTIIFGVRRLDPTERHQGMIMAVAVESVVKLLAFLAAGIFVTYVLYDGFGDIFTRMCQSRFANLLSESGTETSSYMLWTSYLVLALFASLLLPRQFHVAVVENTEERHILTAMWLFPAYLLLINLFVLPIAGAGLLKGYLLLDADTFVLKLPLAHGQPWLAMTVFIGGVSAATGMIMISAMTLSTMMTNHLLLPTIRGIPAARFLRRHLLRCRWVAVVLVISFGYWFERQVTGPYMLVNIGLISFAAVLQFAPVVFGGVFWRDGNRTGALLGLGLGFAVWAYTQLTPLMVQIGWLPWSLLQTGAFGLTALNPRHLFGLKMLDPLTQTLFWSMLFNVSGYVLGSLATVQSDGERELAESFVGALAKGTAVSRPAKRDASIELAGKLKEIRRLLLQYFPAGETHRIIHRCLTRLKLQDQQRISIIDMAELHREVETTLSGAIGAAAAHKAMGRSPIFSEKETLDLMEIYREVLAASRITPAELKARIDYYQERETLLTAHAQELTALNRALGQSERKYRQIFENAPEGIFQTTLDGRFLDASPAMARILGYDSPAQLMAEVNDIGAQLYQGPSEHDTFSRRLVAEGKVRDFECRFFRRDRGTIWVSIQAHLMKDDTGAASFIQGFIQDISERKQAQEALEVAYRELEKRVEARTAELRQTNEELLATKEAAEAATRAKSEFLASMSHEIRTPMNGVMAAAELALGENVTPQINHYLKIIYSSAQSLLGIINDILDFSKIEAGKLELETGAFRLDEILEQVVDLFSAKTAEKHIELLLDIDPQTPRALFGDPFRLQQIFKNLIDNAIKFTDKGGVILVSGKPDQVLGEQVLLAFSVRDTGVGISEEQCRLLFSPFTQADASTTRKYGGTGLGLSITKQLVELMGGDIGVESRQNVGSTFSFSVRVGLQPEKDQPRLIVPAEIRGLRVLLVDDCSIAREVGEKMLRSLKFEAVSVESGPECIARLQDSVKKGAAIDVVLLDWVMPGMDGIAVAGQIRTRLKLAIPIIMMTAFGRETQRIKAQQAGVNGFLIKPVSASTLYNAILEAMGRQIPDPGQLPAQAASQAARYRRRLQGARILVAEDNATNQEIARALLEGAGLTVEIAENGQQAVEAVARGGIDAVLMDVQMPVLDGYEATRAIRGQANGMLPIIAMTAHAMKGDEQRCLDAGMDAYVSKPVDQQRLFATLWRLLRGRKRSRAAPVAIESFQVPAAAAALPETLPGIDGQHAIKTLGLTAPVYRHILVKFFRSNRDSADLIQKAWDAGDYESVRQLAHALKGSAANIGAMALAQAASALEQNVTDPEVPADSELISQCKRALALVLSSLEGLEHQPSPAKQALAPADPALVAPIVKRLADALEAADPERICREMAHLAKVADQTMIRDLEKHIGNYDYDEALRILERIRSAMERGYPGVLE